MQREVDITKEDVRCIDLMFEDNQTVSSTYELWFDVEKYFGIEIPEDSWINFYTFYHKKEKDITCVAILVMTDEDKVIDWELTSDEKNFFLDKMETYCQNTEGCSLDEFLLN